METEKPPRIGTNNEPVSRMVTVNDANRWLFDAFCLDFFSTVYLNARNVRMLHMIIADMPSAMYNPLTLAMASLGDDVK